MSMAFEVIHLAKFNYRVYINNFSYHLILTWTDWIVMCCLALLLQLLMLEVALEDFLPLNE